MVCYGTTGDKVTPFRPGIVVGMTLDRSEAKSGLKESSSASDKLTGVDA